MNTARALTLAVLLAAAVTALGTAPASAVTVYHEATEGIGNPCSGKVEELSGTIVRTNINNEEDCRIRLQADDLELGLPFGLMIICDVAMEGYTSRTSAMLLNPPTLTCDSGNVTTCTGTGDRHASVRITSGTASPWAMEFKACLTIMGITNRCHLSGTITQGVGHSYQLNFTHTTKCENSPSYSLQGTMQIIADATHPEIEIVG